MGGSEAEGLAVEAGMSFRSLAAGLVPIVDGTDATWYSCYICGATVL